MKIFLPLPFLVRFYLLTTGGREGKMTPEARPCSTLRATKIPSPCSAARGIRRLKTEARQIETPNTTFEPYVSDSAPPVSGQQACPNFGGSKNAEI